MPDTLRTALILAAFTIALLLMADVQGLTAQGSTYVGSETCGQCHPEQYERYSKYSKKAQSSQHVIRMATDLKPQELAKCFECHVTGYGQPGGFVSFEQTPHLANAGCEVCHGPGSLHAESGDPSLIKSTLTLKDCESCHNEERVASFGFKPLIHAGAH
jgi:hypothetical protein